MAQNKITKKEVITKMLKEDFIKANQLYTNFLAHELELLEKKATRKASSDKSQEDAVIKNVILEVLAVIGKGTVTEIQLADDRIGLDKYRNQKISAILKKMCEEDCTVVKVVDKRKSLFFLAEVGFEDAEESEDVEVNEDMTEKGGEE